jgi:hypothetical protein
VSTPEQEALLEQAIDHVNAGELQQGRALLERVLEQDPRNDRAWVWLSGCVEDPMQRRICLQQALAANPKNQAALDGMQVLEGNLVQASETRPSLLESRLSAIGMGDQPSAERPTQAVEAPQPESTYEEYSSPVPIEEEEEVAPRPRRRGMLLLVVGVVLLLFLIVCALVVTQVVPVLLSTFL